jgi:hypothetical protein
MGEANMRSLYSQQAQAISRLQAKLQQRDAALFAILEKTGPQTMSQIDMNMAKPGNLVVCDFDVETLTVTFRAVKPKEISYEEVPTGKEKDQQADCYQGKSPT